MHIPEFLEDRSFRQRILQDFPNAKITRFWQRFDNWSGRDQREEVSSFLNRMEELLDDLFVSYHIGQKRGLLDIRKAIMNRENLFIHLPIEEMPYQYAGRTVGTFLLLQIYAATFSFASIPEHERPKFTLIVDEFSQFSFAGKEFRDLFAFGRGYGIKQVLCHQYRSQLHTPGLEEIAEATTGAQTIVCLRVNMPDAAEMAPAFTKLSKKQTELQVQPLNGLEYHKNSMVKEFFSHTVLPLLRATKLHETMGYENVSGKSYRYEKLPSYDLGTGIVEFNPHDLQATITALNDLIYYSEKNQYVEEERFKNFIDLYGKLTQQVQTKKVVDLGSYRYLRWVDLKLTEITQKLREYARQREAIEERYRAQVKEIEREEQPCKNKVDEIRRRVLSRITADAAFGIEKTKESRSLARIGPPELLPEIEEKIDWLERRIKTYETIIQDRPTQIVRLSWDTLDHHFHQKTTDNKKNQLVRQETLSSPSWENRNHVPPMVVPLV